MEDGAFEETVVVRYLLGDLPEEAQVRLEDRAFSDPEFLRVIEAVETDLIDAYVREEMGPRERRQFEGRFLASPERRKKIEFARALVKVSSESTKASLAGDSAVPTLRPSWRATFAELLQGRIPAFQFAMSAVALALLFFSSWEAMQFARLRKVNNDLESQRILQQQRENSLQQNVEKEKARADELLAQVQQLTNQSSHAPLVASLVLVPGTLRSEGTAQELTLTRGAQLARIQIQLEDRDHYPQFRAELETGRGEPLLTRNNLREQRSSAGRVVVLEVPASILERGQYELALKGLSGGQAKDIGFYQFSVTKK
jgi:hypothetical protein